MCVAPRDDRLSSICLRRARTEAVASAKSMIFLEKCNGANRFRARRRQAAWQGLKVRLRG
jgi:hypothetical protein